ncbi:MAG: hypothetical protein AB7I37_22165 [Pirellulales bacterium]
MAHRRVSSAAATSGRSAQWLQPAVRWCALCLAVLSLAAIMSLRPALADTEGQYALERFSLRAFINADASVGLSYDFTIRLRDRAPPLGGLYLPLPHEHFDLRGVRATLNNSILPVRQDRHGQAGFWMQFQGTPLERTDRGKFHIEVTVRDMVAAGPRRAEHAILEFDPPLLEGMSPESDSDIAIAVYALPGIRPDELHPSDSKHATTGVFDGRATVAWRWPRGKLRQVGAMRATFPRRGMHRLAARSPLGGPVRWLERHVWARIAIGATVILAFWFFYFRFTNGRGLATFLVTAGVLAAAMAMSAAAQLVLPPALAVLIALGEWQRRRTRAIDAEESQVDDDIQVEILPPEMVDD